MEPTTDNIRRPTRAAASTISARLLDDANEIVRTVYHKPSFQNAELAQLKDFIPTNIYDANVLAGYLLEIRSSSEASSTNNKANNDDCRTNKLSPAATSGINNDGSNYVAKDITCHESKKNATYNTHNNNQGCINKSTATGGRSNSKTSFPSSLSHRHATLASENVSSRTDLPKKAKSGDAGSGGGIVVRKLSSSPITTTTTRTSSSVSSSNGNVNTISSISDIHLPQNDYYIPTVQRYGRGSTILNNGRILASIQREKRRQNLLSKSTNATTSRNLIIQSTTMPNIQGVLDQSKHVVPLHMLPPDKKFPKLPHSKRYEYSFQDKLLATSSVSGSDIVFLAKKLGIGHLSLQGIVCRLRRIGTVGESQNGRMFFGLDISLTKGVFFSHEMGIVNEQLLQVYQRFREESASSHFSGLRVADITNSTDPEHALEVFNTKAWKQVKKSPAAIGAYNIIKDAILLLDPESNNARSVKDCIFQACTVGGAISCQYGIFGTSSNDFELGSITSQSGKKQCTLAGNYYYYYISQMDDSKHFQATMSVLCAIIAKNNACTSAEFLNFVDKICKYRILNS